MRLILGDLPVAGQLERDQNPSSHKKAARETLAAFLHGLTVKKSGELRFFLFFVLLVVTFFAFAAMCDLSFSLFFLLVVFLTLVTASELDFFFFVFVASTLFTTAFFAVTSEGGREDHEG